MIGAIVIIRKLRALVITPDSNLGLAMCEIIEIEGDYGLWVETSEEWQIAFEVYKPDMLFYHGYDKYPDPKILDYFCGQIPITLISGKRPPSHFMCPYIAYGIDFLQAPFDVYDLMDALHHATASLKNELTWLDCDTLETNNRF